jgi:uncharacterized protein
MEQVLAGFVRALRAAGAATSTAEAIDAARAVALVGYADRDLLKDALAVSLAKTADDKAIHERVFEMYFASPAQGQFDARTASAMQPQAHDAQLRTGQTEVDALLDLAGAQAGPADRTASTDLQRALARAAQAVGVDDIRFESQIGYFTGRMLQQLGMDALALRLLQRLTQHTEQAQAEALRLQQVRDTLHGQARALVQKRFELFGQPATDAFMADVIVHRPMHRLAPADMERMQAVVARMARRLAYRHSRRRRVRLRGQLDLRHTLRANAGHGGVPFELRFRHRRRERPRIVVLCDVSGSVAAHVRFLLLFLYALQGSVTDLRCFAFSNRLFDVAAPLQSRPFDEAVALILSQACGGATDYGRAFADLREQHWDSIDRRTTVLVLGDARSNHADPRLDIVAAVAGRAKRLVWLCPEPPGRWGSGDSCMLQYRPLCTHVTHCANAMDLERAVDETLQAYD